MGRERTAYVLRGQRALGGLVLGSGDRGVKCEGSKQLAVASAGSALALVSVNSHCLTHSRSLRSFVSAEKLESFSVLVAS